MPQLEQPAVATSGWVRMVTRSGVGKTCTTTKPAGISGRRCLDNESLQGGVRSSHAPQRLPRITECAANPKTTVIANKPEKSRSAWTRDGGKNTFVRPACLPARATTCSPATQGRYATRAEWQTSSGCRHGLRLHPHRGGPKLNGASVKWGAYPEAVQDQARQYDEALL